MKLNRNNEKESRRNFLRKVGGALVGTGALAFGGIELYQQNLENKRAYLSAPIKFKKVPKFSQKGETIGFYLTIDDGPNECLGSILDLLNSDRRAVFFVLGSCMEDPQTRCGIDSGNYTKDLVRIIKGGHIVGNHGYSHKHLSELSHSEIEDELRRTDYLINQAYDLAGKNREYFFFRCPFGDDGFYDIPGVGKSGSWDTKKFVHETLDNLGYKIIPLGIYPQDINFEVGQISEEDFIYNCSILGNEEILTIHEIKTTVNLTLPLYFSKPNYVVKDPENLSKLYFT